MLSHSFWFTLSLLCIYPPESQLSHVRTYSELRIRKCAHKPDVHWPYGLDNHIPIESLLRWIAFALQQGCVPNCHSDRVIPLPCSNRWERLAQGFCLYNIPYHNNYRYILWQTFMPTALIEDHALNRTYKC